MNFIYFMPDELRAESVGCYGHPLAPTPNLDALAAQGTRFDQCHVPHGTALHWLVQTSDVTPYDEDGRGLPG